jgi:hypothetical protein
MVTTSPATGTLLVADYTSDNVKHYIFIELEMGTIKKQYQAITETTSLLAQIAT